MSLILNQIDKILAEMECNEALRPSLREFCRVFAERQYERNLCLELIQGFILVLNDHNCRLVDVACDQLLHHFVSHSCQFTDPLAATAHAKYLTAAPLARYMQGAFIGQVPECESVPLPQGHVAFTPRGDFGRWWKVRLQDRRFRNAHLWYSWFQVKRNTPPVTDSFLLSVYQSHRATLTKPDPCVRDDHVDVFDEQNVGLWRPHLSLIEHELTTIAEVMNSSELMPAEAVAPKRTACVEASRGDGGQLAAIRYRFGRGECPLSREVQIHRMDFFPYVDGLPRQFNCVVSTYVDYTVYKDAQWWNLIRSETNLCPNELDPYVFSTIVPQAGIQGVLEPLKVRVISKGPALLYWICKPVQVAIWKAMKEIPCFRLIGRPIDPLDVQDCFAKKYVASVDYRGATDNSSQAVGYDILRELLSRSRLSSFHQEYCLAAYGPHELFYPHGPWGCPHTVGLSPAKQINGQLMGSIMSFVVLCLLNLLSLRLAEHRIGEVTVDPLVNGDDMAYSSDSTEMWVEQSRAARQLGFIPSTGKCYLSTHAATMNSVLFVCNQGTGKIKTWRQCDYLPTGLIHNRHKVQGNKNEGAHAARSSLRDAIQAMQGTDTDEADLQNGLPAVMNVITAGAMDPAAALRRFISYNSAELAQITRGRNLFIPYHLGGLGVKCPPNFRYKVTPVQLNEAALCLDTFRVEAILAFPFGPLPESCEPIGVTLDEVKEHWSCGEIDEGVLPRARKGRLRISRSRLRKESSRYRLCRRWGPSAVSLALNDLKGCEYALNTSVPSQSLDFHLTRPSFEPFRASSEAFQLKSVADDSYEDDLPGSPDYVPPSKGRLDSSSQYAFMIDDSIILRNCPNGTGLWT